jgi:serine/threonine protein kinase
MSDSLHPPLGKIIAGKYALMEQLGEGAMGTVWLATHLNLNQRVAVKLISPELADSEQARARFDAEAKAAAALRSRFVVQIYDSGITDDGTPYLVMEYLTGESLEERVEAGGPLKLEYAVQIVAQVAKGLARAHAVSIVHRDLKPANVFLAQTEDGEEVAKILDFGVAKMKRDGPDQSATATGAVVGTPLFMSPEQARGLKTVDHRADLYSLGMVAYWMFTGQTAFEGEAFGDLILAICTKPLPVLNEVAPWLPPELNDWFKIACALEPGDRYQSAEDLTEALLAASGVREGTLHSVGLMTGQIDESARFAMSSAPDLALSIRRSAAADSSADTMLAATATGPHAAHPRQGLARRSVGMIVGAGALLLVLGGGAALFGTGDATETSGASTPDTKLVAKETPPPASVEAEESQDPQEPTVTPQNEVPAPSASVEPAARKVASSPAASAAKPTKPTLGIAAAAEPAWVPPRKPTPHKPKPKPPSGGGDIDIGF